MKCWRFLLSWSSSSINLLLFPSPRGPLAPVIKRDVITRRGGPLQLQPPRNSPSIRQQPTEEEKEVGEKNGKREGEKWRIKQGRRYGPERRAIRRTEREQQWVGGAWGEKGEGDRKRKESNSGWTAADLSWLDIRRTSRPWRLLPSGKLTSAKSSALRAAVGVKLPLTGPQGFSMSFFFCFLPNLKLSWTIMLL